MNNFADIAQWFLLGVFCGLFAYQTYLLWLADRDYKRWKETGKWEDDDEDE